MSVCIDTIAPAGAICKRVSFPKNQGKVCIEQRKFGIGRVFVDFPGPECYIGFVEGCKKSVIVRPPHQCAHRFAMTEFLRPYFFGGDPMKLVVLLENTAPPGLLAGHGLSLYLEAAGKRILFDAGQSGAFASNAEALGVDLKAVELAVLSHGHYDHGGGMAAFRQVDPQAPIYVNQAAFAPYFHGPDKFIGLPADFPQEGLVLTRGRQEIAPGLTLVPCPGACDPEMLMKTDHGFRRDDFSHEQALYIEEAGKTILLTGCAHCGVLNLLERFRPNVLIGGFHLRGLDAEAVARTARAMAAFDTTFYTGHCTGTAAFAILKQVLGPRIHPLATGTIITEGATP